MKKYIPLILLSIQFLSFKSSLAQETESVKIPEIVVTSDLQETRKNNSASSITLISNKELRSKNPKTLSEALKGSAGVDVLSLGSPGDDSDIRIRGSDRDEVLILLDGIRLNTVAENRTLFLDSIPLDNIDHIEILRGSQSVFYGSDAVGGVIQIFTKKTKAKNEMMLRSAAGNLGTFEESLKLGTGNELVQHSLSYSRKDQQGRLKHDSFFNNSLQYKIDFFPSDKWHIQAGTLFFNSEQEIPYEHLIGFDADSGSVIARLNPDQDRKLSRLQSLNYIQSTIDVSKKWRLELQYNYNILHTTLFNSDTLETVPSGFSAGIQDYHAQEKRQVADLRNFINIYDSNNFATDFTLGFEFLQESFHYQDIDSEFPTADQKSSRRNYAPYFQERFSFFNDQIILSGGARFDHNTTFGNEWSPRASLLVKLPTQTALKVNYGEGFHAPNILDFYNNVLQRDLGLPFQNIKLEAEKSKSLDFGIEQKLGDFATFSANAFRIDYEGLLDELLVIEKAQTQGIEVEALIKLHPKIEISGAYTFLDTRNFDSNNRLASRPKHQGHFAIQYSPLNNLDLRLDGYFVGSRKIANQLSTASFNLPIQFISDSGVYAEESLKAYQRFDLSVNYKFEKDFFLLKDLRIFSKFQNIFNKSYEDKFGIPASRFTFLSGFEFKI